MREGQTNATSWNVDDITMRLLYEVQKVKSAAACDCFDCPKAE
jgi:hypothetical protein